jgi:hypothetical protein
MNGDILRGNAKNVSYLFLGCPYSLLFIIRSQLNCPTLRLINNKLFLFIHKTFINHIILAFQELKNQSERPKICPPRQ